MVAASSIDAIDVDVHSSASPLLLDLTSRPSTVISETSPDNPACQPASPSSPSTAPRA